MWIICKPWDLAVGLVKTWTWCRAPHRLRLFSIARCLRVSVSNDFCALIDDRLCSRNAGV